jgi:hypothetical protein
LLSSFRIGRDRKRRAVFEESAVPTRATRRHHYRALKRLRSPGVGCTGTREPTERTAGRKRNAWRWRPMPVVFTRYPVVSLAAEYLTMGYLLRRNILSYKAPPNNEGYDLICIHPDSRVSGRQIRIQVKSRLATDNDRGFPVKARTFGRFTGSGWGGCKHCVRRSSPGRLPPLSLCDVVEQSKTARP